MVLLLTNRRKVLYSLAFALSAWVNGTTSSASGRELLRREFNALSIGSSMQRARRSPHEKHAPWVKNGVLEETFEDLGLKDALEDAGPSQTHITPILAAALKSNMENAERENEAAASVAEHLSSDVVAKENATIDLGNVERAEFASASDQHVSTIGEVDDGITKDTIQMIGKRIGKDILDDLRDEFGGALGSGLSSNHAMQAILNGRNVSAQEWQEAFPFIVFLHTDSLYHRSSCTGTVIASDEDHSYVLTAGHCMNYRTLIGDVVTHSMSFNPIPNQSLQMAYLRDSGIIAAVGDGGQAKERDVLVGWRIVKINGNPFDDESFKDVVAKNVPFELTFEDPAKGCCKLVRTAWGDDLPIVGAQKHPKFGLNVGGVHDFGIAVIAKDSKLDAASKRVALLGQDVQPSETGLHLLGFGPFKRGGKTGQLTESTEYRVNRIFDDSVLALTVNQNQPTPSMPGDSGGPYYRKAGDDAKGKFVIQGVHCAGQRLENTEQRFGMVSHAKDFINAHVPNVAWHDVSAPCSR